MSDTAAMGEDGIGGRDSQVIVQVWKPDDHRRGRARSVISPTCREPDHPRSDHLNRDYAMTLTFDRIKSLLRSPR